MKSKILLLSIMLWHVLAMYATVGGSEVPFADPYILLDKGTYYAYGTHSDGGIEVYTSKNLKTWKYCGHALDRQNTSQSRWFWAPEVYKFGKKYYMYYTANLRLYVATADSPLGPFRQQGDHLLASVVGDTYTIDSSLLLDDDGKTYLFFVRDNDGNCIWSVQLADDHVTPLAATMRKCIHVDTPWENIWPRVNEGPNVVKHNGIYYLTYSANSFESKDYGVGYATTSNLQTGMWQKFSGNPILRRYGHLVGTGHHSIFADKHGKLRIVFHAHYSDEAIHPRCMYIGTMKFVGNELKMISAPIIVPKSNKPL